jgi:spore germination cell wall hydrolase CwlJ-like protein
MIAVAWVVLNRMRSADFPRTVCGVVKQGSEKPGCQFSYWCDGKGDTPEQDAEWALAGGARFYHAVDIDIPWTVERKRTARIGRHVYYR